MVEFDGFQKVQGFFLVFLGFPGEAGDKRRAQDGIGAFFLDAGEEIDGFLGPRVAAHGLQKMVARGLDGDVEIMGDDLRGSDEVDEFVRDLAWVKVKQTDGIETDRLESSQKIADIGFPAGEIDAVDRRVLRDERDFLHPGSMEGSRFLEDFLVRPAFEAAADEGDRAEGAEIVAPLGDAKVSGVWLRRNDPAKGVHRKDAFNPGKRRKHGGELGIIADGDDGSRFRDLGFQVIEVAFRKAADNHDFRPVRKHLENRVDRFFLGGFDEAARVDDDEIGVAWVAYEGESVAREHRENHLAVDEVLGAAEAHEPDADHAARPHF